LLLVILQQKCYQKYTRHENHRQKLHYFYEHLLRSIAAVNSLSYTCLLMHLYSSFRFSLGDYLKNHEQVYHRDRNVAQMTVTMRMSSDVRNVLKSRDIEENTEYSN